MVQRKKIPMTGEMEAQAARLFGKHVSKKKAWVLLVVTLIVCALPIIRGVRLWDSIAEIVTTGIIRIDGQDDSMPRPLLVFGIPGLLCALNLIVHIKLLLNQKQMTLPKLFPRLFGRWGFPVLSTVFANAFMIRAAGQPLKGLLMTAYLPGLTLLLLGSHMLDCPQHAPVAPRLSFIERDARIREATHRFSAYLWMAVGLGILTFATFTGSVSNYFAVAALGAFAASVLYGWLQNRRVQKSDSCN